MTARLPINLALVAFASGAALGQPVANAVDRVDPRAEVAAALYAAAATQAAAQRETSATIRAQRTEIDRLRSQLGTEAADKAHAQAALTAAEEDYVAALAASDRAYAQEISVFRAAVQDIVAIPEGATALARFNAGDEVGALAILDDLRAARDAARQKRADIESAAEGRRIATLALDARAKGKLTTAQVIARYEDVTRLDPGVQWDWVELSRLYQDAGRLGDAQRAAQAAADTAATVGDRIVPLDIAGDMFVAKGDRPAALASYRAALAIADRLSQADPDNADWHRSGAMAHEKIGNVLMDQGDLAGGLEN